ncbi:hypothetical protein ACSWVZ_000699 [Photobacterium damselae]|uniref:hypothetical protein n=1 Tax=Photobacterium damselae TaxID=38293 RepID=UPI00165D9CE8|nr:hypothetical protein [Photobacterium damselae]
MRFGSLIEQFLNIYRNNSLYLFFFLILLSIYIDEEMMSLIMFTLISVNIFISLSAYYFHSTLRKKISNNINYKIYVISRNNVTDFIYPAGIISNPIFEVPSDIVTIDRSAHNVYEQLKSIPFIHLIFNTIHNKNYYKFDWLKVDKIFLRENLHLLKEGDMILYHSRNSFIGKLIRLFCRCYWEHCAVYIGNGFVFESTPPKTRKTNISDWFYSDNVDIGILRYNDKSKIINSKKCSGNKELPVGVPYSYMSVLLKFWDIVTYKEGDGLVSRKMIISVILVYSLLLSLMFFFPYLTRLVILLNFLISIYTYCSLFHWFAFNPLQDDLLKNNAIKIFGD